MAPACQANGLLFQPRQKSICMKSAKKINHIAEPLPITAVPRSEVDTTGGAPHEPFENLYLFANLANQFRSLRIRAPLLDKVLSHLLAQVPSHAVFLHLPQHSRFNRLVLEPKRFSSPKKAEALLSKLRKMIPAAIAKARKNILVINNSNADIHKAPFLLRPYHLLAAQVRYEKDHYGWLGLIGFDQGKPFERKAVRIVETLANQLAVMLANMTQYDALEHFTINIVCSLVCAIESKDAYANGHSERVHQYALQMARKMKMDGKQIEALRWSALFHDIGKIGIPERILQKPSRLTKSEFALIKKHPQKAAEILKPIRQLGPSLAGIVHHHERYNGTGYPQGLKGEQIPVAARIISVADTFDAITSPRSYHKRRGVQDAMLLLDQVAGTQLDPYLVRIFKAVYRQNRK